MKAPSIDSKIIGLRKNGEIRLDSAKGSDSSFTAITHKVQEILVNCKDLKSNVGDDNGRTRLELTSKWVALLTLERACMSIISLEDTSGSIRKNEGNFKENVRELGWLDVVFDVAIVILILRDGYNLAHLTLASLRMMVEAWCISFI